jgi:flagellar basal body-associated protein FliL
MLFVLIVHAEVMCNASMTQKKQRNNQNIAEIYLMLTQLPEIFMFLAACRLRRFVSVSC